MTRDDLLGRRYEFTDRSGPDITVISLKPDVAVYVHIFGGDRQWLPWDTFMAALTAGVLQDSPYGPFVYPPLSKFEKRRLRRIDVARRR